MGIKRKLRAAEKVKKKESGEILQNNGRKWG